MRKALLFTALLLALALVIIAGGAGAEEAENMTSACEYKVCSKPGRAAFLTDGKYTSYWESEEEAHPWITISSDQPVYGLYPCFYPDRAAAAPLPSKQFFLFPFLARSPCRPRHPAIPGCWRFHSSAKAVPQRHPSPVPGKNPGPPLLTARLPPRP